MINIFLCALLTVIIEAPFMYLLGYRKRDELLLIACVNIVTNLLLNLGLSLGFYGREVGAYIYVFESAVVAAEFILYSLAFRWSWKLFLVTLAANCLSYGVGLLIF